MPQSRRRKSGKAKKRNKGSYPTTSASSQTSKSKNLRTFAIVVIAILALSAIAYLLAYRGKQGGAEITTASGLKYIDTAEGTGPTPRTGQLISVHYTGTLVNGTKFDSSYDRGQPYEFRIGTGAVIKGWDEGLMTVKVGGKRKLIIPPSLGYRNVSQPKIPANSTLLFDVELVDIK